MALPLRRGSSLWIAVMAQGSQLLTKGGKSCLNISNSPSVESSLKSGEACLATSSPKLLDARAAWNPFTVFRSHAFRYLWTANLLSMIGSQISRIGLILYLSKQQSGAVVLAGMLCCDAVPGVIAALLSGALLDRWHKVRVMIGADVIRMLVMVAAALAPSVAVIYIAVGIQSIATVLFGPARSASLPLALGEDELD